MGFLRTIYINPLHVSNRGMGWVFYFLVFLILFSNEGLEAGTIPPSMSCDFFGYEDKEGAIEVGDTIVAKDIEGVICGRDTVRDSGVYGFLSCYGDDPETMDVDEGAVEGEVVRFFINGIEQLGVGIWHQGVAVHLDIGMPKDQSSPAITLFELSDQTSGSMGYTNNNTIDVVISAFDDSGDVIQMIQSEYPEFTGAEWVGYQCSTRFELSLGDGLKTIYCKVRDESENESVVVERHIILDTIVPQTPSVTIKDIDSGSPDYTNDETVSVDVDNDLDAVLWIVSEQVFTKPGEDSAEWGNEPSTYIFDSTEEGIKTVYVWIKDIAGNVSSTLASDEIILDTTSPKVEILEPNNGSGVSECLIVVSGRVDDVNVFVEVEVDGKVYLAGVNDEGYFSVGEVELEGGANTITARAVDLAGNIGEDRMVVFLGYVLHLDVPCYEKDREYYSGAASCKMLLDYIREEDKDTGLSQDMVYDYGHRYNYLENVEVFDIDPQGIDAVLGHFDPYDEDDFYGDGSPWTGYNFGIEVFDPEGEEDAIVRYMRDICHWVDYLVPPEKVRGFHIF